MTPQPKIPKTLYKFASSEKSVGGFWFWKRPQSVIRRLGFLFEEKPKQRQERIIKDLDQRRRVALKKRSILYVSGVRSGYLQKVVTRNIISEYSMTYVGYNLRF